MRLVCHLARAPSVRLGELLWLVAGLAACGGPRDPMPQGDAAQATAAAPPQTGEASYYGRRFAGEETASGTPFDPRKMTAASPDLPLGTKARVTNQETGRSVEVTVNDRGPFDKGRILDVSPKAADRLGMKSSGVAEVEVRPVQKPKSER